jgi:hypothetical protein
VPDREVAVRVRMHQGQPVGASAAATIDRPVARVWDVVEELDAYPRRIPMIHRIRRDGDRITVDLRFKIALFSVGFQFVAALDFEREKWLELRWVSGVPRGIRLRFELEPEAGGRATLIRGEGEFDIMSVGWLVKVFLRHHPEIRLGVFPGVALALVESMRAAAEE